MTGFQHTWWRIMELDLTCAWWLEPLDLAAGLGVFGLAVLWMARKPGTFLAVLAWALVHLGLCGAGNAFTLVCFWTLGTVGTLALFRASTDGGGRGLYAFALGAGIADGLLLLGYLFYASTYRDSFLPTEGQFREATVGLTTIPAKLMGLTAVGAAAARVAFGSGSLWLTGEPRLEAREIIGQRLVGLLLPSLVLLGKFSFLRSELPVGPTLAVLAMCLPAVFGAVAHSFGGETRQWLNPARWFEELVEKPVKTAITFLDRRIEVRLVDACLVFPAKLSRAGSVWISLLQSGSLASYLTLSALGMAALLAWVLWGRFS